MSDYRLDHGVRVEIHETDHHVHTVFPDGTRLVAHASFTPEDAARARALGYPGNDDEACWAMHQEHDLLHHVIAQAWGFHYSETLHAIAAGHEPAHELAQIEERLVFLLARALNQGRAILPAPNTSTT